MYPLFVSQMNENNYRVWIRNKLTPVIPRSVRQDLDFNQRMKLAEETY